MLMLLKRITEMTEWLHLGDFLWPNARVIPLDSHLNSSLG